MRFGLLAFCRFMSAQTRITISANLLPILGGLGVFGLLLLVEPPEGMPPEAWRMVAIIVLMLTWWISEAIPLPVTGLVPLVLMPLCGISPLSETGASYAAPVVFLIFGGMVLARAMELTGLPRRITFFLLRRTGTGESGIILGFMISAGFLSMWMSNTGATAAMLPIALSVVAFLANPAAGTRAAGGAMDPAQRRFAMILMLAVAFAANIGGTATLIGTAPNAVFAGFSEQTLGAEISFLDWMLVGVPFAVVMLLLSWLTLTRVLYRSKAGVIEGAETFIQQHYRALGRMSMPERRVAMVLGGTIFLWLLASSGLVRVPGLSNGNIAILGAIACFIVPAGRADGSRLLQWPDMQGFPWGVWLMFGGGLALAGGMVKSGLAAIIGSGIAENLPLPEIAIWIILLAAMIFLTELVSNTAILAAMLPILFGIAADFDAPPVIFALPMALAVSCAFMLPTATPPNAIVFSSGFIRVREMMRAGFLLNLIAVAVAALIGLTLVPAVFG